MAIAVNIVTDYSAPTNGTSNAFPAFHAFQADFQGEADDVILTCPAHTYAFLDAGGGEHKIFAGIPSLTVVGTGATFDASGGSSGIDFGGYGQFQDDAHSARTATVLAGASSVPLITPAQASLFTVGKWGVMTGLDLIGSGYPSSQAFFEFVKVSDITGGTVSFEEALANTYKSTWPLYNPGGGSEIDCGGPATLYALDDTWDCVHEYQDLTVIQGGSPFFINANGRSITFRNMTFTDNPAIPSQNKLWQMIGCTMASVMECDKLVEEMVIS